MSNDKKQNDLSQQAAKDAAKDMEMAPDAESDADENDEFDGDFDELPAGPVELLEIEVANLKDRYIRLAADMENLRKRTERERSELKKYAVSEFARDILPLSDNFQRAIDAVPLEAAEQDEALKSFLEGVKMNERELQKVLEKHGVTQLTPKGEKFDPNIHQAVQQIDNNELPNNTVVDVFQVGYVIADRVLRPAVVSVAKGGPKTAHPSGEPPMTLPEKDADEAEPKTDPDDIGSSVDKSV